MQVNPYQNYQQNRKHDIETADRVSLIRMLLEGAINYNRKAMLAVEDGKEKFSLECINSSLKIVMHLYDCLDFDRGGEIAERLGTLYNYVCDQYVVFSKQPKDLAPLESINQVLNTILDGWKQLPKAE